MQKRFRKRRRFGKGKATNAQSPRVHERDEKRGAAQHDPLRSVPELLALHVHVPSFCKGTSARVHTVQCHVHHVRDIVHYYNYTTCM